LILASILNPRSSILMFTTLVSLSDLAAHLDDPGWIVFDCRHDLTETESGRQAYFQSHIPGARFIHLDNDLSAPKTGRNGRHPLSDAERFCERLAAFGMASGKQAVAYDASGGYYAARLWWMLRWVGHEAVGVLDGGWDAWLKAGKPLTAERPLISPGSFDCRPREAMAVDVSYVKSHLDQPDMRLIDARGADRFRGENETLDPVGGHIPGALNRSFRLNLDGSGYFKTPTELRNEFVELLGTTEPSQVVHQCGSGVTACHNLLAMEIAGLGGSKLYPGSWSEWCSDPSRPVAR
jgi:thiosulfate/3-mercaptopyruvate sulfurtransferase